MCLQDIHSELQPDVGFFLLLDNPQHPDFTYLSFQESVAEDTVKDPPIWNVTTLLSKTSMYKPGVINFLMYVMCSFLFTVSQLK